MRTQISIHSDLSLRNGHEHHIFEFSGDTPKTDFFISGRILRFAPSLFDRLRRRMSQMIEFFFLQNSLLLIMLSLILYEKEIKFEKILIEMWSSVLSLMHECFIKARDFSVNFGYDVASLTANLSVHFLLKNLIKRLWNFSSQKIEYSILSPAQNGITDLLRESLEDYIM
jgi:hypothetical protein